MDRIQIRKKLEKILDKNRFEHSLGVSYTAASMAMVHGADVEGAALAGLLHDCAKCFSHEEKLEKCKKHNLPINKFEKKNPELLHAKLSAYYAQAKYEVEDLNVLSAITYHTTGRPDMSTLEKIIFIADYIEPNRKPLKEMDIIRKEAFTDLNLCVTHILKNTLSYLAEKNADIDETSKETYDFYVMKKNQHVQNGGTK